MSRFIDYETPETKRAERLMADHIIRHFGCSRWFKNDAFFSLDFALLNAADEVQRYVETKWRPWLATGYGDGVILGVTKAAHGRAIYTETGAPCHFAIWTRDNHIRIASIFDHHPGSSIRGRADRPDGSGYEPCVVFPWDRFEDLGVLADEDVTA